MGGRAIGPGARKEDNMFNGEINVEKSEKGFYHFDLFSGSHHHIRHRIWVNNKMINFPADGEGSPTIKLPVIGAKIERTEKGALVLRPCDGVNLYLVWHPSGYRGNANIEVSGDAEVVAKGKKLHSPQGATGETAWALVNAWGETRVTGLITGRRISDGRIDYKILPSGEVVQSKEEGLEELLK
jgi:hypothetical protein